MFFFWFDFHDFKHSGGAGRAFNSCIVVVANFLYVVAVSNEEMVSWSPSMNTILVQTLYCSTQAHRCIPIVKKINPET